MKLEKTVTVISYEEATQEETVEQPERVISYQKAPLEEFVEPPETLFDTRRHQWRKR